MNKNCTPIIELIDKKLSETLTINILYKVVTYLLTIVFIIIIGMILTNLDDKTKITSLLAPLGIILSASIASLSVMKNIENTNKIENKKIIRELYDKNLEIYNTVSYTLGIIISRGSMTYDIVNDMYFKTRGAKFTTGIEIVEFIENLNNELLDFSSSIMQIESLKKDIDYIKNDLTLIDNDTKKIINTNKLPGNTIFYRRKQELKEKHFQLKKLEKEYKDKKLAQLDFCKNIINKKTEFENLFEKYLDIKSSQ